MIVKRFGCTAIHNKALYKCIIHSFIIRLSIFQHSLAEKLRLAVCGSFTLTFGKIWVGSGSTSRRDTLPTTAWAPVPTSGMPRTNTLR